MNWKLPINRGCSLKGEDVLRQLLAVERGYEPLCWNMIRERQGSREYWIKERDGSGSGWLGDNGTTRQHWLK